MKCRKEECFFMFSILIGNSCSGNFFEFYSCFIFEKLGFDLGFKNILKMILFCYYNIHKD
jgi:hypothetical protein